MKIYVKSKSDNKSQVSASQKQGYLDAAKTAKKYPKAMKVLG